MNLLPIVFPLVALMFTGLYFSSGTIANVENLYAVAQLPGLGSNNSDDDNNTSLAISTVCRGDKPCQSLVCNNDEPCYVSKSPNLGGSAGLFEQEDRLDEYEDSLEDLE
jgi:hypothetical protein